MSRFKSISAKDTPENSPRPFQFTSASNLCSKQSPVRGASFSKPHERNLILNLDSNLNSNSRVSITVSSPNRVAVFKVISKSQLSELDEQEGTKTDRDDEHILTNESNHKASPNIHFTDRVQ